MLRKNYWKLFKETDLLLKSLDFLYDNDYGETKDIDSISYGLDMSGRICTIILVPDKD